MSTIDRPFGLPPSLGQGASEHPGSEARRRRPDAPDSDRRAIEEALSRPDDDEGDATPLSQEVPRPLSLLGSAAQPVTAVEPPIGLAQCLEQAADRLLVADGSNGRGPEVRIALKDEVLPGVTVSIYEGEGRLVAEFICADEQSREKLNACAPGLAQDISQALRRPVLVRVVTEDPDDPCLYEASCAV